MAPGETGELTAEQKKAVLAQVGDRTITLGEYVATLERMDPFERLRYQSPERRKLLLDEMIEVELLAQEARRRGLDKTPETRLRIMQAMRDEVLEDLKRSLPDASEIPEGEVKAYYQAHRDEFREPERRRVLHIELASRELAEKVAKEAQGASGAAWGELARKHSLDRRGTDKDAAPELAGDLGLVSAPGEKRGANDRVPEELRKAVFELAELGDVTPKPVESGGHFHVVRVGAISKARDRTFQDAERTVRVELLQKKFLELEKQLEAELSERFPVEIDEKAVKELQVPTVEAPADEAPDGNALDGKAPAEKAAPQKSDVDR